MGIGYAKTYGNSQAGQPVWEKYRERSGQEKCVGDCAGGLSASPVRVTKYALLKKNAGHEETEMRDAQKKEVLEVIKSLQEAHEEIRSALERKDRALARQMVAECQEFAISLGESIERLEGQKPVTVSYIEAYCEMLFWAYGELEGSQCNEKKVCKFLKKQLLKIENSAKYDIAVRKEVVFLPYKASMWDSLESVWRAAWEDEACDAYVVPIPYYDKNPDGSFRELHYEGDAYPPYVPVTWYGDYDFEKRKPDMIFIHNPYDDCNIVTSVDPFFYSANLKKYTERLIYIPYFVLDEIKPDEKERIEGMKHFCTVPGVVHADQVIVQSEDMRQVYIQVLAEAFGGNSPEARKYWSDKILGLGSPKFDKVAGIGKEEADIPEDWRKLIWKPDGCRKKVILYNTGVTALLIHNEEMLAKMKDVFRIFQENQEEVVLLWRPHPLIESTLASMRPYLWQEYREIRDRYLAEGWGIYDDTVELDRAIGLSDAYYGDESSLVQLYKRAGKPVMLQNVEYTYMLREGDVKCEEKESD